MSAPSTTKTLQTAYKIGVLGDTHDYLEDLLIVSHTIWKRGVSVLLVLGEFGLVWPRRNWGIGLSKLSRQLVSRDQIRCVLDGTHEDFSRLYAFPLGADLHVDETGDYLAGGKPFTSRVLILGMNQGHGWSQVSRDVAPLDVQHVDRHYSGTIRSIEQMPEGPEPGRP